MTSGEARAGQAGDAPGGAAGLRIVPAPVDGELGPLLRPPTPDLAPYSRGLEQGRLLLQRCASCSRPRWPLGPICPHCDSPDFAWDAVAPSGRVHSWIRYRRSFLAEFEPLVPYTVVCARMDDGDVSLFGRLISDEVEPRVEMPVAAVVERWSDGSHVLAFEAKEER